MPFVLKKCRNLNLKKCGNLEITVKFINTAWKVSKYGVFSEPYFLVFGPEMLGQLVLWPWYFVQKSSIMLEKASKNFLTTTEENQNFKDFQRFKVTFCHKNQTYNNYWFAVACTYFLKLKKNAFFKLDAFSSLHHSNDVVIHHSNNVISQNL